MRSITRALALALALLGTTALLAACNGDTPGGTESTDAATEAPTTAEVKYRVALNTPDGSPVTDVILKVHKDGSEVTTKVVGPTGAAAFTLPAADYTLSLESPSGTRYYFDGTAALTPAVPELTLTVYPGVADTWRLSGPSKLTLDGSYADHEAGVITEGTTYVELNATDHTYLVFNPTRGGIFEFTASEGIELAYHGMPILIYDEPRMEPDDKGVLTIPVEATSIGSDSVSQLVFRVTATEGSGKTDTLVTVKWTGEIQKSPEEQAPWVTVEADRAAIDALATFKEPAEGDKWLGLTAGTLTNLNVEKDASLTVVLADDGYYHLGTADGPMVFVRITSDSPYVEDFVKMCETDRLRAYFYDENGTFLRKEGYNTLFAAYGEVANADGVVPLNEQLAYVIQNTGRHMGWWNYDQNSDIFGDAVIDPSIAWLFACAVYQ